MIRSVVVSGLLALVSCAAGEATDVRGPLVVSAGDYAAPPVDTLRGACAAHDAVREQVLTKEMLPYVPAVAAALGRGDHLCATGGSVTEVREATRDVVHAAKTGKIIVPKIGPLRYSFP